jgi:hypothetical protein
MLSGNEAFSRVLIDKALEASGWGLLERLRSSLTLSIGSTMMVLCSNLYLTMGYSRPQVN